MQPQIDMRDGYLLDSQSGHFISQEHRRVAEVIQDWNPDIYVVWIPPEDRAANEEFPYALMHSPPDRPAYIIKKIRESELNERLIAWLWANDTTRTNPLANLEKEEAAAREALRLKREMESAAAQDFALSVLQSPLNIYRHGNATYR